MPRFYSYVTQTPNEPEMVDEPQLTMVRVYDAMYITETDVQKVVDTCRDKWPNKSFKVYKYHSLYNPDTYKLVHRFDSTK